MGKKVRTPLTIDEEVLKKAMKIRISVSQYCENALKEAIIKLQIPKTEENSKKAFLGEVSFAKESSVEPRAGFDPATHGLRNRCST